MSKTQYILSLSYGKDSLACLAAIEQLGWPLDRIVHAEVWATDTIHADLPPMIEFKEKADRIIKERWGIEVEHYYAMRNGEKLTYEKLFYSVPNRKPREREREVQSRHNHRVPNMRNALVQQHAQALSATDFPSQSEHGAGSSSTAAIYGFPIYRGNWCTALKQLPFRVSAFLGAQI